MSAFYRKKDNGLRQQFNMYEIVCFRRDSSPSRPGPPYSRGFYDALQSVGLLWASDQLIAETST